MGYYTSFEFSHEAYDTIGTSTITDMKPIVEFLAKRIFGEAYDSYYDSIDRIFEEDYKWYDHQTDMRELSKMYPNELFTLTGYGEDFGDFWREYYLNGKMQYTSGEIVFEDFEEDLLR